jgi:hypothetical protein
MEKSGRNTIPITFPSRDDSAKIEAFDILLDIIRDQLALEVFFLKDDRHENQIDDSRAGAFKRIVEDIIYPSAFIDIKTAVGKELSRKKKSRKKPAKKSPAKKSQSRAKSLKSDS